MICSVLRVTTRPNIASLTHHRVFTNLFSTKVNLYRQDCNVSFTPPVLKMSDWVNATVHVVDGESSSDEEDIILLAPMCHPSGTETEAAKELKHDDKPLSEVEQLLLAAAAKMTLNDPPSQSAVVQAASPQQKSIIGGTQKTLLVLDLNGLFFYREYTGKNTPTPNKSKGKAKDSKTPQRNRNNNGNNGNRMGNFLVWDRPFVKPFLVFLFKEFDVAVWSSAAKWNVDALVKHTLTNEQRQALKFCWYNDMCTDAGKHPEHDHKNLYLKELSKVWEKFPEYSAENTLLIDDSPLKAQRNPPFTAIHPQEWDKDQTDDKALSPTGWLTTFLQKYLKQRTQSGCDIPSFVQREGHVVE